MTKRIRAWFHRPRHVVVNLHVSGTSAPHVRATINAAIKAELAKLSAGDNLRIHHT